MKNLSLRLFTLTTFALFLVAQQLNPVQAATYKIDPDHSQVIFKVKHMGISTVTGLFDTFEGKYSFDDENIENSHVETKIVASSINTNKTKRDNHLRSDEFLDVEKHPLIIFKSKKIKKGSNDNEFKIVGDLTIHGITKSVELTSTFEGVVPKDPWGNERSAFIATAKINRKDFDLTWNKLLETGQLVVGDDVRIVLEVEGIRVK